MSSRVNLVCSSTPVRREIHLRLALEGEAPRASCPSPPGSDYPPEGPSIARRCSITSHPAPERGVLEPEGESTRRLPYVNEV
eukprot:scaffold198255_cov32-Tisochrysis_lutea.AAC.1